MDNGEFPPGGAAGKRRVVAIALGAAALGGLGVWLYLRTGGNPHYRASPRIEDLQERLNHLADELSRYAARDRGPAGEAREV